jgi:hypothetical protein
MKSKIFALALAIDGRETNTQMRTFVYRLFASEIARFVGSYESTRVRLALKLQACQFSFRVEKCKPGV